MRKLVFGAFSPDVSLHVYEEGGSYYVQNGFDDKPVSLRDAVAILSLLKGSDTPRNERYLIRESADGWFCEFVAEYYPSSEVFVVGYGDTKEAAMEDCQRRIAEFS